MGIDQLQVTLMDSMGSDLSIVNAARCSFGKKSEYETVGYNQMSGMLDSVNLRDYTWVESGSSGYYRKLKDQDVRLLKYLAKHKHMSPFGHVFLSFHIKAPIFVHAQLLKHKFLRANTISRRYVDSDIDFYRPDVWRGRSEDKKQGSSGVVDREWSDWQMYGYALETYNDMIEDGVAPEMARMVLQQSLMTDWYFIGSLDAFADMVRLRIQEDSQYESRIVAGQVYQLMKGVFPVAAPLLVEGVLTD